MVGSVVVVRLLEGYVLARMLKLGYRLAFWYAALANILSMGPALIWYFTGSQVG